MGVGLPVVSGPGDSGAVGIGEGVGVDSVGEGCPVPATEAVGVAEAVGVPVSPNRGVRVVPVNVLVGVCVGYGV